MTIAFSFSPLLLSPVVTGQSKGFGFAQFSSVEAARAFVDPQFPFIQVPPPASHGASATAAFHKALKTGGQHSGRRVKIDYSQSANPNAGGRAGRMANANDGTRDIGNSPTAILLFRGLDPLSGPQAIELAMKTSSGPHKEGAKGMKRIVLIKDKTTLASWGFAFVEFVDVQVFVVLFITRGSWRCNSSVGRVCCVSCNYVTPNSSQWFSHIRPPGCYVVCPSILFPTHL